MVFGGTSPLSPLNCCRRRENVECLMSPMVGTTSVQSDDPIIEDDKDDDDDDDDDDDEDAPDLEEVTGEGRLSLTSLEFNDVPG